MNKHLFAKLSLWIFVLTVSTIACGMATTIPTTTPHPTSAPVEAVQISDSAVPTMTAVTQRVTVTADTLYIRREPSTSADVLDQSKHFGDVVIVGILVPSDNPRCSGWYPVQAPNGWICADFVK